MTTYQIGDTFVIHGSTWKVVRLFTGGDGTPAAALEDTVKPRYGSNPRTAFNLSVLDAIATKIS